MMPESVYQPGSYYVPLPPATYVSASGEFGVPGGPPPQSYQSGLAAPTGLSPAPAGYEWQWGEDSEGGQAYNLIPIAQPSVTTAPIAAPTAAPAQQTGGGYFAQVVTWFHNSKTGEFQQMATSQPPDGSGEWVRFDPGSPSEPPGFREWAARQEGKEADPYAAFKAEWAREFPNEPLTQDMLNDNAGLVKRGISNDLFRLLPLDRQMGFSTSRIALLDNTDQMALIAYNPAVANDFPTSHWKTFSNDWLARVLGPIMQQNNPAEWTNIVNQNQIGGANAGALPAEITPPAADLNPPAVPSVTGGTPGAPVGSPAAAPAPYYGTEGPSGTPSLIPNFNEPAIGQGDSALDIYRNTLNMPAQQGDVRYRLSGKIDQNGNPVTEPPDTGGDVSKPPYPAPTGKTWNYTQQWDSGTRTYVDKWELVDAQRHAGGTTVRIDPRPELTAEQIDRLNQQEETARKMADLAERKQDWEEMRYWADRALQLEQTRVGATQRQEELGLQAQLGYAGSARADLQANLQRAGVTGYYGGVPTQAREQAIADQQLKNYAAKVDAAYRAGQLSLQDAQRLINQRAQTESETQGAFGRNLQTQQFNFQVAKDPASAFVKAGNAANLIAPGGGTPYQDNQRLSGTGVPLTNQQAFAGNPNLAAPIQRITGGNEQFQLPSYQGLQALLPSQREQVGAGLQTMGYNPEDIFAQSQRLTTTTAPAQYALPSRRRRTAASLV